MIGKGHIRIEFERAMLEAEYTMELDGLDVEFIKKASVSDAFKLNAKDFQSLTYKNEIRFLISKAWFPDLQMSDIFVDKVDVNDLNRSLNIMSSLNASGFMELLNLNKSDGFGPGEVLLYFLLDNGQLGGGKSAGVDIIDNGTEYEIKAVKRKTDGTLYNFKLGGTVKGISKIAGKIMDLKEELLSFNPKIKEGETTGINNSHLNGFSDRKFLRHLKNIDRQSWDELLKEFQAAAYNGYFKAHPVIFVGSKNASKNEVGRIYSILKVKQNQIGMSVTSGTIKPEVNPNL
jgi:hypothetical protein